MSKNNTNNRYNEVNGLLDKGCTFEGKLSFDGSIQINGNFNGEIYSEGVLVIGNDAQVTGTILVDTCVIFGHVEGTIEAKTKIELHSPAVVIAHIKTNSLAIDEGVLFHGQCAMDRAENMRTWEQQKKPIPSSTEAQDNNQALIM